MHYRRERLIEAMREGTSGGDLPELVEAFRRCVVEATLERAPSSTAAAKRLGITREWIYKLRRRYGLPIQDQVAEAERASLERFERSRRSA